LERAVELEIPARPEYIALARLVVSAFAAGLGTLADERIDDLKVAVSEACTNAVEAHGAIATDERVTVRCVALDDGLEVTIADRGGGFDPAGLASHPPATDPERLRFERGLGIPLIRSLADEVEFRSSSAGTLVRIVMRANGQEG
jgi:serine/threonine-protein kinase RsbW